MSVKRLLRVDVISTHAPHAGSDVEYKAPDTTPVKFQPTLPMRGATATVAGWFMKLLISTHAPHAGSDKSEHG